MKRFAKMEPYACLHLLVLVLGTALMISGCFHGGLWFDESYTVGMMRQSFGDMLRISVADVHPPFYYIALWLFTRVFGCSAVAMRLARDGNAALERCQPVTSEHSITFDD